MAETTKAYWGRQIAGQEASGQTARQYCREQGIGEHSFYVWRKRLRESAAVRFALVETRGVKLTEEHSDLELVLVSGDRVRIGNGVDQSTLRTVLDALRG
jgi:transposase-like protein